MKLPEEIKDWKFGSTEQLCEAIVRDCAETAADFAADQEATKTTQQIIKRNILARYGLEPKK